MNDEVGVAVGPAPNGRIVVALTAHESEGGMMQTVSLKPENLEVLVQEEADSGSDDDDGAPKSGGAGAGGPYGPGGPGGPGIDDEVVQASIPTFVDALWHFTAYDVTTTVADAVTLLFRDVSASKEVKKKRAEALTILGEEFIKARGEKKRSLFSRRNSPEEQAKAEEKKKRITEAFEAMIQRAHPGAGGDP